MMTIQKLPKC